MDIAASDLLKLHGVNPAIVRVLMRAARDGAPRFAVIEGTRTVARQRELVARGASKTMKSRHIHGFAVDIAPVIAGKISWDWPAYYPLAKAIKAAAAAEGVALTWGGDWRTFKDGPHWELPHATHPDPK
ncbi:MAG: M15 family metallopeptidase [Pseudomonadota bacterium]